MSTTEDWGPWVRGVLPPPDPAQIKAQAEHLGVSEEIAAKAVADLLAVDEVWINNLYQVNIRRAKPFAESWPGLFHLSIKRRDKQPIHDWRHLQRIKNDLVGPEHEGVELYPAESRLVDTANQYHLWVFDLPDVRFPFGFVERFTIGGSGAGAVQRPFKES